MKFPILYVAASADPTAVEWVQHTTQEERTEKPMSGDVVLPGFHVRPKDAPASPTAQCLRPSARSLGSAPSCCAAVGSASDLWH